MKTMFSIWLVISILLILLNSEILIKLSELSWSVHLLKWDISDLSSAITSLLNMPMFK